MEKYFVTGAMGFIGSHWCEYLLKKGKAVYGLDLGVHAPHLLDYDKFTFIHDTIKNYDLLKTAIEHTDCICHFAGIAEPHQYTQTPRKVIDVTAVAGIHLIEMCRLSGKLFFFTSTSEVYGKSRDVPFKEDGDRLLGSTTTKRWCYATSKALLEHYLDACAYSKELNHVTVRLFNVYGPRLRNRVVGTFLDDALSGRPLQVHGDGTQTRSFTYVDDVMEAFDLLIHNSNCYNEIFNIGNTTETSIIELANLVKKVGDFDSEIRHIRHADFYGSGYEDIDRRVPNITKINDLVGWKPTTALAEGIAKTLECLRAGRAVHPSGKNMHVAV